MVCFPVHHLSLLDSACAAPVDFFALSDWPLVLLNLLICKWSWLFYWTRCLLSCAFETTARFSSFCTLALMGVVSVPLPSPDYSESVFVFRILSHHKNEYAKNIVWNQCSNICIFFFCCSFKLVSCKNKKNIGVNKHITTTCQWWHTFNSLYMQIYFFFLAFGHVQVLFLHPARLKTDETEAHDWIRNRLVSVRQ